MEFIASFFSVVFVGLILVSALAFGFVILAWVVAGAVAFGVYLYLRELFRRWSFLRSSRMQPPQVIEAEYKDISE